MAETSRSDNPPDKAYSGDSPGRTASDLSFQTGALELPVTSAAPVSVRASNAQLNRSAEAVGRSMGNAVAGVKSIPQQFDRLRSRIHLVHRYSRTEGSGASFGEVAEDWREAVEESVSEVSEAANRYRLEFLDRANVRILAWQHAGERGYFHLRRELNYRVEKARRISREQPVQFLAGCAVAAFTLGVVARVWRSNDE